MAESLSVTVVAVTEANGECWIAAVKQARIEAVKQARIEAVKQARIEALHGARIALMHRTRSRPCSARFEALRVVRGDGLKLRRLQYLEKSL